MQSKQVMKGVLSQVKATSMDWSNKSLIQCSLILDFNSITPMLESYSEQKTEEMSLSK